MKFLAHVFQVGIHRCSLKLEVGMFDPFDFVDRSQYRDSDPKELWVILVFVLLLMLAAFWLDSTKSDSSKAELKDTISSEDAKQQHGLTDGNP